MEQDVYITTAKNLLNGFGARLEERKVCGSPKLVLRELDTVSNLIEMIVEHKPTTLTDSSEDSLTFLDLPREIILQILFRLPDHVSILEAEKAHKTLNVLIKHESRLWKSLCNFHFTEYQIKKHSVSFLINIFLIFIKIKNNFQSTPEQSWRRVFFELKKYYGLREVYADLITICCHCKALFWKDHGHPCVSKETAPSVRVTPRQFVDMLLFL